MTDHPRFRQPKGDFEQTYRQYHGAPLVSLVLGLADRRAGARSKLLQTAGLVLVLLGVLGMFVYALAHRDMAGAAPAYHMQSPPLPWAWASDAPAYADQPSPLPGKFGSYQGLYLP